MSPLTPGEVTIIALTDKSAARGACTWSSTGALMDAGRWIDGDYLWDDLPSSLAGALRNEMTLVGADGTIGIRFEGLLTPTLDRDVHRLEGKWRVLRGTGRYARLRGGGSASVSFAFARASAIGRFIGRLRSD